MFGDKKGRTGIVRLGCCLQTAILLVLQINCEWFSFVCYTMAISLSLSLSLSLTPTTLECLLRWDDLSSLFIVDVVGDVRVSACAVQLSTECLLEGPEMEDVRTHFRFCMPAGSISNSVLAILSRVT